MIASAAHDWPRHMRCTWRSWVQAAVSIPTADIRLALAALTVGTVVEAGLRCVSLPKLCRVGGIRLQPCDATKPQPGLSPLQSEHVRRVAHAVRRAYTKGPLPDSCLRRCLCAGFLLRRYEPRLVLGVRNPPRLEAHAWLDLRGTVLDWNALHDEFIALT